MKNLPKLTLAQFKDVIKLDNFHLSQNLKINTDTFKETIEVDRKCKIALISLHFNKRRVLELEIDDEHPFHFTKVRPLDHDRTSTIISGFNPEVNKVYTGLVQFKEKYEYFKQGETVWMQVMINTESSFINDIKSTINDELEFYIDNSIESTDEKSLIEKSDKNVEKMITDSFKGVTVSVKTCHVDKVDHMMSIVVTYRRKIIIHEITSIYKGGYEPNGSM